MPTTPEFDVFLSHSSVDKPEVLQINFELRKAGLNTFLDSGSLQRGMPFQPALSKALDESGCCAIFLGPSGGGPWQNEELNYALNLAARTRNDYRVIPVLLPGCDPSRMDGFLALRAWVDFRHGVDDPAALEQLIAAIKGEAPAANDGLPKLPDDPRPYRGLQRFEDAQSQFYFGRNPDIERLTKRLQQDRIVVVMGASGSGKSSLVRSGLHTAFAEKTLPGVRRWHRVVLTPGKNPLLQLAASLVGHLPTERRLDLIKTFQAGFSADANGLITALVALFPQQDSPVLVIIDQFEELFTQRPLAKAELPAWRAQTASFAANLRSAIEKGPDWLRVIVTLRADFLARFISDDFPDLRQLLETRQFWVTPMTIDDFREVIVRPAQERGAYFEKGLVERILRDMRGEATALPLLEEALDNMWDRRRGHWLTNEGYDAIGGVGGALAGKADDIFNSLSSSQKTIARNLFTKLVQLGEGARDTRRRINYAEARSVGDDLNDLDAVLAKFSDARLITRSANPEDAQASQSTENTIEVTHETVIDHWGRLTRWLDEGRPDIRLDRRLAEAAQRWDEEKKKRGKPGGILWRPPELNAALSYVTRRKGAVSPLQAEFVKASKHSERLRKLGICLASVGTPLFLFVAASAYLISIARPDAWVRVLQPDSAGAIDDRILPVHDIAINRSDPSLILYLGRNAAWTHRPFRFVPKEKDREKEKVAPEFVPAVEAMLKSGKLLNPVAKVSFTIHRNDEPAGSGQLIVFAVLDDQGKTRFYRTLDYQGQVSEERGNKTVKFSAPPTLLPEGESAFDLGDYAEPLAEKDLFENDDTINGEIADLVTDRKTKVEYDLADGLEWGSSRKALWGPEFKIFADRDESEIKIGGIALAEHRNDADFWKKIAESADWQVYRRPVWTQLPGGIDAKREPIQKALAGHGDAASLEKGLRTFPWTGDDAHEYLEAALLSTGAPSGTTELLRLKWSDIEQGHGPPNPTGTDWLIRIGGADEWKNVNFPFLKDDDIRGVWSLEKDGKSALLLTAHQGFYRTRDGGLSWEAANYDETGFTSGTKVKPVIVNSTASTFALIDRGTAEDDGENPLFILQHRTLLQRWSAGFAQLFK